MPRSVRGATGLSYWRIGVIGPLEYAAINEEKVESELGPDNVWRRYGWEKIIAPYETGYMDGSHAGVPANQLLDEFTGVRGHPIKWKKTSADRDRIWALWRPNIPQRGTYEVSVFVPGRHATTRQAHYHIHGVAGTGQEIIVKLDQSRYSDQWVPLVVYEFDNLPEGAQEPVVVPASTAEAVWLARELAGLMDEMETAEVAAGGLTALVGDELAAWWQVTLEFLQIMTAHWPHHLEEIGRANPAAHRSRLIDAEAERLARNPPAGPVVAAGSTGSIPATARLLSAIARLPSGAVVLPGCDGHGAGPGLAGGWDGGVVEGQGLVGETPPGHGLAPPGSDALGARLGSIPCWIRST